MTKLEASDTTSAAYSRLSLHAPKETNQHLEKAAVAQLQDVVAFCFLC